MKIGWNFKFEASGHPEPHFSHKKACKGVKDYLYEKINIPKQEK